MDVDAAIFTNATIHRGCCVCTPAALGRICCRAGRLGAATARLVLDELVRQDRAEWIDPPKQPLARCLIYWHTPREYADAIYAWVTATGQNNSVLTAHELVHSELVQTEIFAELDDQVLRRALQLLESGGKARVIRASGGSNEYGVKFY